MKKLSRKMDKNWVSIERSKGKDWNLQDFQLQVMDVLETIFPGLQVITETIENQGIRIEIYNTLNQQKMNLEISRESIRLIESWELTGFILTIIHQIEEHQTKTKTQGLIRIGKFPNIC